MAVRLPLSKCEPYFQPTRLGRSILDGYGGFLSH